MLKILSVACLYTALSLGAIAAAATPYSEAAALREGTLKKLNFHSDPQDVSRLPFQDLEGVEETLADHNGQVVVLNFWATWCAPCRKEMPALDALAGAYKDKGLTVLPIATGHNPIPAVKKFFASVEIENLPIRLDPTGKMARDMGVLGLPVTIILAPDGSEIARMTGDAEWFSPSAQAIVETLLSGGLSE